MFIDDLTFDRDDATYSVLKTILEGGVERRPLSLPLSHTKARKRANRPAPSFR